MGMYPSGERMLKFQLSNLTGALLSRHWSRAALLGSFPKPAALDLLCDAIERGIAAGSAKRRPTQEIRLRARSIRDHARAENCREVAISKLLEFVRDHPDTEEFQKIVARLLHEMHDERALEAWLGISLRFPRSMDAFHNLVVLTHRQKEVKTVRAVLQARFPRMPKSLDQLLAYAEACDMAGATAERRSAFKRLARTFEKRNDSWLVGTSWLEEERTPSASTADYVLYAAIAS